MQPTTVYLHSTLLLKVVHCSDDSLKINIFHYHITTYFIIATWSIESVNRIVLDYMSELSFLSGVT